MSVNAPISSPLDIGLPLTPEQIDDPKVFNELLLVYRAIRNLHAGVSKKVIAELSSSVTQVCAAANTAYVATYDTQEILLGGVAHSTTVNPSRVSVPDAGTYICVVTYNTDITGGANLQLDTWLRVNGVDVPRTRVLSVLNNTNAADSVCHEHPLQLNAGDYVEVAYSANDARVQMLAVAAAAAPTRPASPSISLSLRKFGV